MSLFGRREKRQVADLKADKRRLADKVEELQGDLRTERFNAKSKTRQNEDLADENARLKSEVASLGQLLTREVTDAVEDVAAAEARTGQYAGRLRRALKACARYRADLAAQCRLSDFLGQQFIDSVSGNDPRLKALADAVKDSEVTG